MSSNNNEIKNEETIKNSKSVKNKKRTINKKRLLFVLIILAILILGLGFIILRINEINKAGNTVANIRNFGYAAEDDKYIYYRALNAEGNLYTINRINKSLKKEPEVLISGDWLDITGINVYKNNIYFVTRAESNNSESDSIDNQIHKMKKDGTDHNVINNNDFHNSCYEIYVIKNKIYYIGTNQEICTMNLDGTDKRVIPNTENGFIGVTDRYILFNKVNEDSQIVTYMMNLNGSKIKEITGFRLYAPDIIGDEIYYLDDARRSFKYSLDDSKTEMLTQVGGYYTNVTSDGIYYVKFVDSNTQGIFKRNLDGTNETELKRLNSTTDYIMVLEDWIVYMDTVYNEGTERIEKGIIAMISKDGKKYQELYSLEF